MAITINGTGSITGLTAGGLPDGSVTAADIETSLDLTGKTVTLPSGTGGKVLQVVSEIKTDKFTTSSTTATSITGLFATITPTSTSSKILVIANIFNGNQGTQYGNHLYLYYNDGSTTSVINDATGDTAGSRRRASGAYRPAATSQQGCTAIQYLHSPAKSTEIYYQIYMSTENASYTATVNSTGADGDSAVYARTASTVTLLEVAA
jgi:hypothetical protein